MNKKLHLKIEDCSKKAQKVSHSAKSPNNLLMLKSKKKVQLSMKFLDSKNKHLRTIWRKLQSKEKS